MSPVLVNYLTTEHNLLCWVTTKVHSQSFLRRFPWWVIFVFRRRFGYRSDCFGQRLPALVLVAFKPNDFIWMDFLLRCHVSVRLLAAWNTVIILMFITELRFCGFSPIAETIFAFCHPNIQAPLSHITGEINRFDYLKRVLEQVSDSRSIYIRA
jgi:hypothetical protein